VALDFDSLWHVIVGQLVDAYRATDQSAFILPASKNAVHRYLDELKLRVNAMEEFEEFPEGNAGVVVFALLWDRAGAVTDAGEFGLDSQGLVKLIEAFGQIAEKENPWFPTSYPL